MIPRDGKRRIYHSLPHRHSQLVTREFNWSRERRANRFPHCILLPFDVGCKMAQQQTLHPALPCRFADFLRRCVQII